MRPKVFIAQAVPPSVREYLDAHCDCRAWEGAGSIPRRALVEGVRDADGLLVVGQRIDTELLKSSPRLRVVSNISVGYNNLDIGALRRHGVLATHTPGVLDDTVADLIMTLMLSAARRVPELDRHVKAGRWKKTDGARLFGVDVHHATLGIIGLGRIGAALARRAVRGFDMSVLYHNRRRRPDLENELGVAYAEMDALLSQSDFVLLMVPLTAQTERFIGEEQFQRMRSSAIFINASRGATVDEAALARALENGTIRGAGLDVYTDEPLAKDSPLARLPQAVTLPHIGSATARTRQAMAELAARNLVTALAGERPPAPIPELADLASHVSAAR